MERFSWSQSHGPTPWSQPHGASPMEPVPRSQSHGASPMEPVPRSQSHGASPTEPVPWSQSHGASPTEPVPRSQSHGASLMESDSHTKQEVNFSIHQEKDQTFARFSCESLAPQDYIHVRDVRSLQSNGLLDSFHFC